MLRDLTDELAIKDSLAKQISSTEPSSVAFTVRDTIYFCFYVHDVQLNLFTHQTSFHAESINQIIM